MPFRRDLAAELKRRLRLADQGRDAANRAAARELHRLADRLRFLYGAETYSPTRLSGIEARCQAVWRDRGRILRRLRPAGGMALEPAVRDDLLDLAIVGADLHVRLAPPEGKAEARRRAVTILDEAELLCGRSPVLDEERRLDGAPGRPCDCCAGTQHGLAGGQADTAWEHYALGRALFRAGHLDRAEEEVDRAVRLQPQGLWQNFYHGLCAYRRGRYEDAVRAYSVCIGAAAEPAGCFYNRGLALAALGRAVEARDDYERALRLDPTLTGRAPGRGALPEP